MDIQIETITPKAALEIIAASELAGFVNRPLAKRTVEAYAQDMKAGKWQFNGEPIRIDISGNLIDGQHRLHAIVRAGLPQDLLIIRGIEKDTFSTIDRGRTRSLADILAIDGYTSHVKRLPASAKAIYQYVMQGQYTQRVPKLHVDIIRGVVRLHEKRIIEGAKLYEKYMKRPLITSSILISLSVFFDIVSRTDAFELFDGLLGGANLSENDPRFIARNKLLEMRGRYARSVPNQAVEAAFVIMAWNKFKRNETVKLLRWNIGNDFPQILGLPVEDLKEELERLQ